MFSIAGCPKGQYTRGNLPFSYATNRTTCPYEQTKPISLKMARLTVAIAGAIRFRSPTAPVSDISPENTPVTSLPKRNGTSKQR